MLGKEEGGAAQRPGTYRAPTFVEVNPAAAGERRGGKYSTKENVFSQTGGEFSKTTDAMAREEK